MDGYDIRGADFCKFYVRPPNSHCKPGDILLEPDEDVEFTTCHSFYKSPKEEQFVSKSIQTDYRESECQTDPWDPPYRITKVYDDPEVLSLSKLSYGDGLPAGILEVKYASEKREHKNAKRELENNNTDDKHTRHKQIMCDQVRSEWKYRLAIENEKLNDRLSCMESSIIEDFQKYAVKKEVCLKNMWMHRKDEITKTNLKLQQKLNRELKALKAESKESNKIEMNLRDASIFEKNQGKLTEGLDYAFSNYYLSNPMGLSTVKSWLEKKTDGLTTKIPLIRKTKRTTREKMAEEAYQNILEKKRAKLPPKIYREDFESEKPPTPSMKSENVLEVFDFDEKKVDMVTVLQQALHGLSYQKQMLELIEKHKDGLSTVLPLSN